MFSLFTQSKTPEFYATRCVAALNRLPKQQYKCNCRGAFHSCFPAHAFYLHVPSVAASMRNEDTQTGSCLRGWTPCFRSQLRSYFTSMTFSLKTNVANCEVILYVIRVSWHMSSVKYSKVDRTKLVH